MHFPPILVINLEHRKDRWKEIQESFQDWPSLERMDAVKASPGWKGCNQSHMKALKIAKEKEYPWVLVLEDDCDPAPNSLTRFKQLLPSLWESRNSWDVFLGGVTSVKDASVRQTSPPLLNVKGHTTHFCLYNSESYDKLIDGIQKTDTVIDSFYRETPEIRSLCTAPHLATQRASRSDLQEQETNYDEIFRTSNSHLLKVSNAELEGFVNEVKAFHTQIVLADILLVGFLGFVSFYLR
jgi:hypothetical protein